MRATIVLGAALVACASLGAAGAAEIAVIESTSARYVVGQTLDATAPIVLAAGEALTVVHEDARLIRIEGPHNGPAAGPAPDPSAFRRALTQLIVEERPAVGGVGGVRAGEGEAQAADTRPDPWLVHSERSGDQCVLGGAAVGVWRERAGDAVVAEVGVSLARELCANTLERRRATSGVAGAGGAGRRHRLPAAADCLFVVRPDPPARARAHARRPRARDCLVAGCERLHRSSALAAARVAGAAVDRQRRVVVADGVARHG